MNKHVARVVAAAAATLAMTGCVRFTTDTTFGADQTISQDIIIAFEPAAADELGIDLDDLTAESLLEQAEDSFPGVDPSKVVVEDYVDGDLRGVHIVTTGLTLDEFSAATDAGGVTAGLSTPLNVELIDDEWVITIPADESRDLSNIPGGSSIGLINSSVEFALTFNFPVPVVEATAGDYDGKTVVLDLEDLLTPQEIVIRGKATEQIAWGPILRWVGIAAVGIGIVGGATWLGVWDARRRKRNNLPPIPTTDDAVAEGADVDDAAVEGVAVEDVAVDQAGVDDAAAGGDADTK